MVNDVNKSCFLTEFFCKWISSTFNSAQTSSIVYF